MKLSKDRLKRINMAVKSYMLRNPELVLVLNEEYVIDTGTNIMLEYWYRELGDPCNYSNLFVKSVVDNNLSVAITSSDITNRTMLPFYVSLLKNLPYIE